MTQVITDLGEIGTASAILKPIDLPLERNDGVWNLTGYSNETIEVWDLRTQETIASPGSVAIQIPVTDGIVRWTPDPTNFVSGVYEARIKVSPDGGSTFEPSGMFRFALAPDPITP